MLRGHEHDPLYSHREPTLLFDCKVKLNKRENLTCFVLFLNLSSVVRSEMELVLRGEGYVQFDALTVVDFTKLCVVWLSFHC